MKTIKLSLNALVALCCLVFFMTSCQDDAVENEVLPTREADNAGQALVPDDIHQALLSIAEDASRPEANLTARTNQPFVFDYDLSLTVSELRSDEVLGEFSGTLTLWAVNSTDIINFVDLSGRNFQTYQGGYVAVNAQGDTIRRRAAAFVIEGEEEAAFLLIKNIPEAGDVFVSEAFGIMNDSSGVGFGRGTLVAFESDFLEHDDMPVETPIVSGKRLTYDLTLSVFASDIVDREPIGSVIEQIKGTLSLAPADAPLAGESSIIPFISEGDPVYTGTFTYRQFDSGDLVTLPVSAAVSLEDGTGFLDINDIFGTTVDEQFDVVFQFNPDFRPDLGTPTFSGEALSFTESNEYPFNLLPDFVFVELEGELVGEVF